MALIPGRLAPMKISEVEKADRQLVTYRFFAAIGGRWTTTGEIDLWHEKNCQVLTIARAGRLSLDSDSVTSDCDPRSGDARIEGDILKVE